MTRSMKKPPYCASHVLRLADRAIASNATNAIIRIRSRSSTILNKFIGFTFGVYNGKSYIPVKVTENIVGRKFGEFAPTRYCPGHAVDKKVLRKK